MNRIGRGKILHHMSDIRDVLNGNISGSLDIAPVFPLNKMVCEIGDERAPKA